MKLKSIFSLLIKNKEIYLDGKKVPFNFDMMEYEVNAIEPVDNKTIIYLTKEKYQKARYKYLKQKGLCVECGCEKDILGELYCSKCKNFRKQNVKNLRKTRIKLGRCSNCGGKLDGEIKTSGEPYKTCNNCREKSRKKYMKGCL